MRIYIIGLLWALSIPLMGQQKSNHDIWDYKKATQLHLWPKSVSFLYENDEIGQRYATVKPGFIDGSWIYLYDLKKNSVFKLSHRDLIDKFDVGAQLHSHYYEMPPVERILSPDFVSKHRELWPDQVNVEVSGSSTKWTHGRDQYLGLQTDVVRTKVSNAFGYLDKGDVFHIELVHQNTLKGYHLNKKKKKREGYYYAPFTNFQPQVVQNFRTIWKNRLARFDERMTYERIFDPKVNNNVQVILINPETGIIEIYSYGYNQENVNYISASFDVSFEMLDFFYPKPKQIRTRKDDPAFSYPLTDNNLFFTHYYMPIPKDWYVNDSTFVIERHLKNWYTPPPPLALRPPTLHDTEKTVLLDVPSQWEVREVLSNGEISRGNSDQVFTMFSPANTDTLDVKITLVIRKPTDIRTSAIKPPEDEKPMLDLANISYSLEEVVVMKDVKFVQSESTFLTGATDEIDRLIAYLKQHPNITVELSGHTDNMGKQKDNLQLSNDRVHVVKKWMRAAGIEKSRISGRGYGATRPLPGNKNRNEKQRAANRRVEFVLHEK